MPGEDGRAGLLTTEETAGRENGREEARERGGAASLQ